MRQIASMLHGRRGLQETEIAADNTFTIATITTITSAGSALVVIHWLGRVKVPSAKAFRRIHAWVCEFMCA